MVFPVAGGMLRAGISIAVQYTGANIEWMYVGAGVEGIFGGSAVMSVALFAYIADITNAKNRYLFNETSLKQSYLKIVLVAWWPVTRALKTRGWQDMQIFPSSWKVWSRTCGATRIFLQKNVQASCKKKQKQKITSKLYITGPLCKESTCNQYIPCTNKWQVMRK